MPTIIMALLILAAVALLATSWLGGRRDRDPSSSVDHFNRAMSAMSNAAPPAPGGAAASSEHAEEPSSDAVSRT